MFEEHECPSRLEHAPDLAQAALWILHRTLDECDHSALKMRIGEWEGLDWGTCECDGNRSSRKSAPGLDQHRLIWFDRLHPHHTGRIVKGEVLPPTGTHFQHGPVCLASGLTPQGVEHVPDERLSHHPVVKCGKTRG